MNENGMLTKNFWDYAKNLNKVSSLENAFLDWITTNKLNTEYAKKAWNLVNEEVKTAFDFKNPGNAGSAGTSIKNNPDLPIGGPSTDSTGASNTASGAEEILPPPTASKPLVGGNTKERTGILDILKEGD